MTESFENKINEIVSSLKTADFNYIFSTKNGANHILENTQMPVVVNVLPVSGTIEMKSNTIASAPNCLIGFFDKFGDTSVPEADAKEINTRMFLAAQEFIVKVNASGYFKQLKEVQYQNIEQYDIGCFGIVLDVQLHENAGTLICSLK